MCNYSKGVYNDGMERGRNTGIAGAADILKRMGMDAGKIVEQLMLQYVSAGKRQPGMCSGQSRSKSFRAIKM